MSTMDPLFFLAILLVTFSVCIFLTWYFYHKAKTKERLILLEKNADLSEFLQKQQRFNFPWLKVGILVTGIGVAFGIQAILLSLSVNEEPLYLFVLFVCGGVSLIIANYVDKRKD
jgi:magnesium-transporting ATPase (P-type)